MRAEAGTLAPVRRSHRRHRLWRALTRTRWLVAALLVVVVVVFALDRSHQPAGCHFVQTSLGKGSYTVQRVCPGAHPAKRPHGAPSYRTEFAAWVGLLLLLPAGIFIIPRVLRLRDDIAIRRERRRR